MPGLEYTASPALRQMLDETSDLLDSPVATVVVGKMLDSGFGLLVEERVGSQVFRKQAAAAGEQSSGGEGGNVVPRIEVTDSSGGEKSETVLVEGRLSNVLAVMKREAAMIGGRAPNGYLQVRSGCGERLRVIVGTQCFESLLP